jgi:hypothetical protein
LFTSAFWTRRPWLALAASFAGSRLVIALIGIVGVATFVDQRSLAVVGPAALDPAVVWHRWDALWYERLAVHGYGWELDTLQGQAAAGFFPLYPLTIGLILRVLPGASFFWVATIFSNVVALLALTLLVRRLARSPEEAAGAVGLILTAAGSFYLSIPYTEGLFLLLVVLVLITTRGRQYWLAGLVCGLAVTTRAHGLALIAIPVIACWRNEPTPAGRRLAHIGAALALFAIPVAIYLSLLADVQGSALSFVEQQAMWGNERTYPFRTLVALFEFPRRVSGWLHGAFWGLYVGLLLRTWKRIPLGDALYCAGALVISTMDESFHGTYRYVVPLVPLMLALTQERPALRYALLAINLIFGTIMILAFVTNNRLAV